MERVVLGLDDEDYDGSAIRWVIELARSKPVHLRLATAFNVSASNPGAAQALLATTMRHILEASPEAQIETVLANRPMLHELLHRSESADLLVIGSRPDPVIRESRTPSFPVSLAARSLCPVVIVPSDWEPRGGPVVVGVDNEPASFEAARFAAREAVETDRELIVVHTWEPWESPKARSQHFEHESILHAIVDRVRAEIPAARVRGILKEAVAHDGIIALSHDAHLVVLGTYRLGRESGVVLGRIHQELMIAGGVAICIVPLDGVEGVGAGGGAAGAGAASA